MLPNWNGSFLDNISTEDLHEIGNNEGCQYVSIKLNKYPLLNVQLKPLKNSIICIIEEIKHFFGLFHYDTHRININDKPFIIMRTRMNGNNIIIDPTLYNFSGVIDDKFRHHIQNIIVFRYLLGIHGNIDTGIRVCTGSIFKPFPLSNVDLSMGCKTTISPVTRKKWLYPLVNRDILMRMLDIPLVEESVAIYKLRCHLDKTIRRIDKKYIYLVNDIIGRVSETLMDE